MKKLFLPWLLITLFPLMSFLQQEPIIIYMVGDSTMANKPYNKGNPEKGWGQVFPLYFKEGIKIENHAKNGRSSKSFRDEGLWDIVLEKIKPGHYVIITFGHNDQKQDSPERYSAPDTDYRKNLERYVRETRNKGGIPVLATPIMRRRFDENGKLYDTHGRYPEVVREIAKEKNVPLLDLHKQTEMLLKAYGEERSKELFLHIQSGEYASLPQGKEDDTHLSAIGAFRVCDLAIEEIKLVVPEWVPYLKD